MSKFRVTYKDGSMEEVEQSDCHTLDAFINTKFGSADYQSNGVVVEMIAYDTIVDSTVNTEEVVTSPEKVVSNDVVVEVEDIGIAENLKSSVMKIFSK